MISCPNDILVKKCYIWLRFYGSKPVSDQVVFQLTQRSKNFIRFFYKQLKIEYRNRIYEKVIL